MKPVSFDYHRPHQLEEALDLLIKYEGDARILAGGQSLIPMMNFRLVEPSVLVDINRMKDLNRIQLLDNGMLRIDGLTREIAMEKSGLIAERYPLLAQMLPHIGHMAIRTKGTIGGSLVQADPAGELPLAMLMLDGVICLQSKEELRRVSPEEFFLTYMTVNIQSDEILVGVELPVPTQASWAFDEFSLRQGDFALVSTAAGIHLDSHGKIDFVRFGAGGIGGTPVRLQQIEDYLMGQLATPKLFEEAFDSIFAADLDLDNDIHASAEYRVQLLRVLGKRILNKTLAASMMGV